ncbi:MAG: rhomboid family intramembrane serine protease [Spirochaetia bacterium]|nr:rhomboid family intramembrane serine protease [Spirochaetia bacterium]
MQQMTLGPRLTKTARNIIIINTAIFLTDTGLRIFFQSDFILYYFSLIPDLIFGKFYIWQLFTYQFLHGGVFHILFNMLALWMFGSELEERWGSRRFLQFYLLSGTLTGLIIFFFNFSMGYNFPTIGASGTLFALLLVYAIYWGNRIVYLWMLFPIKIKYFVMIMGALSLTLMIQPGNSNVSHIAHLGGLPAGYICFKLLFNDSLISFGGFSFIHKIKMYRKKKEWEKKEKKNYDKLNSDQKVDEILAKISRKGIKSLSHAEKKFLKEASERMNNKNIH